MGVAGAEGATRGSLGAVRRSMGGILGFCGGNAEDAGSGCGGFFCAAIFSVSSRVRNPEGMAGRVSPPMSGATSFSRSTEALRKSMGAGFAAGF